MISSTGFHIFGIPLILVFIGVFANRLGRRDGEKSPPLNDWAVGTLILLTALGSISSDLPTAQNDKEFLNFGSWFIGVLFTLFISLDNDRYRSWKRDRTGVPLEPSQKHLLFGVIIPNLIGFIIFIAYQYSKLSKL